VTMYMLSHEDSLGDDPTSLRVVIRAYYAALDLNPEDNRPDEHAEDVGPTFAPNLSKSALDSGDM